MLLQIDSVYLGYNKQTTSIYYYKYLGEGGWSGGYNAWASAALPIKAHWKTTEIIPLKEISIGAEDLTELYKAHCLKQYKHIINPMVTTKDKIYLGYHIVDDNFYYIKCLSDNKWSYGSYTVQTVLDQENPHNTGKIIPLKRIPDNANPMDLTLLSKKGLKAVHAKELGLFANDLLFFPPPPTFRIINQRQA